MIHERYKGIDRKIQQTEVELEKLNKLYNPSSLDYLMTSNQLNMRLEELKRQKDELKQAQLRENVKLIISGDAIDKGKISTRVLVPILQGFQAITDSIANSLLNEPTSVGKIPSNILRQTDLTIVNVFEGSFGVELEADIEDSLVSDNAVITQALDKMFKLLGSGDDADKVLDEISELGSRTLNYYRDWLKSMAEYDVEVQIDRSSQASERHIWKMNKSKVPTILKSLEDLKEEFMEEINIQATLSGLNLRKETFEIINQEDIITGRTKKEVINENKQYLGTEVEVKLVKNVTKNLSTGREKTTWFLKEIISNM